MILCKKSINNGCSNIFTQVLRLITETYARTCFLRVPWGMVWCWTVVGGYLLWSMMPCHHVLPSIFEGTCDKRLSAYAPVKYSYLDRHPFIFERMWAQNHKFEHINPKNLIHFRNFSMGSAGHLIPQKIIYLVKYYCFGIVCVCVWGGGVERRFFGSSSGF